MTLYHIYNEVLLCTYRETIDLSYKAQVQHRGQVSQEDQGLKLVESLAQS